MGLTEKSVVPLAASFHTRHSIDLRELFLNNTTMGDNAVINLANHISSGKLQALEKLYLSMAWRLTDDSLVPLAASFHVGHMYNLKQLFLDGTWIGDDAVIKLASAISLGNLRTLEKLHLSMAWRLTDNSLVPLATSFHVGHMYNLRELFLDGTEMGDDAVLKLAEAISLGNLGALEKLNLSNIWQLTDKSLVPLADSFHGRHMINLRELFLSETHLGDDAVIKLAEAIRLGNLTALEKLDISYNQRLTDKSMVLLAMSFQTGNMIHLTELLLGGTGIEDDGVVQLAKAASLGNLFALEVLDLRECKFHSLPSNLGDLSALCCLSLRDCTNLEALPKSILQLERLEILDLHNCRREVQCCQVVRQLEARSWKSSLYVGLDIFESKGNEEDDKEALMPGAVDKFLPRDHADMVHRGMMMEHEKPVSASWGASIEEEKALSKERPLKLVLKEGEQSEGEGEEREKEEEKAQYLPSTSAHEELQFRSDVQSAGVLSWDQSFNPGQILLLCDVTSPKKAYFIFFHERGMANLFGIGIPYSKISIILDRQEVVVEEMMESSWKAFWMHPYEGPFKPLLLEKSKLGVEEVPQILEKSVLRLNKDKALSKFGISMDGPQVQEFVKLSEPTSQDVEGRIKSIPILWDLAKQITGFWYPRAESPKQGLYKPVQEGNQHPAGTKAEVAGKTEELRQKDSLVVNVIFRELHCDFFGFGGRGERGVINGGHDLLGGISSICPSLRVEFFHGSEENNVTTTMKSKYGMSAQRAVDWPAGWHQDNLMLSFKCSEGRTDACFLENTQINGCKAEETECTQQSGESRSTQLETSSQGTIRGAFVEMKADGRYAKTSQANESISRKSKSEGRKFLASHQSFAVNDHSNHATGTMEARAFLWGQTNVEGSGSQSMVDMEVEGTWVLDGEGTHAYEFNAEKSLFNRAGATSAQAVLCRLESWISDENSSSISDPDELKKLWQVFSRRFVLNHNFSQFFETYKRSNPYTWRLIEKGKKSSPIPDAMEASS